MSFRFDPHDPAFVRDPYPTYKEMRERHPVYRMEETGFWLITRFEDVSRALADPATFSSSRGNSTVDTPVRVGKTLGTIDPPRRDGEHASKLAAAENPHGLSGHDDGAGCRHHVSVSSGSFLAAGPLLW